jgi:hypothetical protein
MCASLLFLTALQQLIEQLGFNIELGNRVVVLRHIGSFRVDMICLTHRKSDRPG